MVRDLIDAIYRAAVDPTQWERFIRQLSDSCGGAAAAISLAIPNSGAPIHGARIGLLDEYAPLFPKHLQRGLPWGSLVMPHYTQGFGFGSDVLANEKVVETDYYREYMQPQGLAPEGPLAHIFAQAGERPLAALVIYRRVDTRALDQHDLERCDELTPHLKRAYRIHAEMHSERERRRALSNVVDRFPMGVALLDSRQRCVVLNKTADEILSLHDGLALVDEHPVAHARREDAELQLAIADVAEAAREHRPAQTRSVSVSRPSGEAPYSVMVSPLTDSLQGAEDHDVVAALFLSTPRGDGVRAELLQKLYGFTPAEAGLVCQLVAGKSLELAARARGIRKTTARGYLKAVYQKTATRSQSDLIRLVLTGVGLIRES